VRSELIDLGFEPDEERENSDQVDEGNVIRCEPTTGDSIAEGSTVTVFVSSGEEQVAVPPLRGQTLDQAERTLEREQLALGTVSQEPDASVPEGSVIRSDPPEGNDVAVGSHVNLVISTGPTPSPTPSPTPTPTPTPVPTLPPTPTPTPVPTDTPQPP
jgi:serine/threonine-protein kinase